MEVVWGIFFNQKFAYFEIQIIWKQLVTQFNYSRIQKLKQNPVKILIKFWLLRNKASVAEFLDVFIQ